LGESVFNLLPPDAFLAGQVENLRASLASAQGLVLRPSDEWEFVAFASPAERVIFAEQVVGELFGHQDAAFLALVVFGVEAFRADLRELGFAAEVSPKRRFISSRLMVGCLRRSTIIFQHLPEVIAQSELNLFVVQFANSHEHDHGIPSFRQHHIFSLSLADVLGRQSGICDFDGFHKMSSVVSRPTQAIGSFRARPFCQPHLGAVTLSLRSFARATRTTWERLCSPCC